MVARLGGDEFAVIQTGPKQDGDAVVLAKRLIHALGQPTSCTGSRCSRDAASG